MIQHRSAYGTSNSPYCVTAMTGLMDPSGIGEKKLCPLLDRTKACLGAAV